MIGEKFNHWTVFADAPRDKGGNKRYLCRCDCGTEHMLFSYHLKNNSTKQCDECRIKSLCIDYSGFEFGNWKVLKEIKLPKQQGRHYECQCKCGSLKVLGLETLKNGTSTQCMDCAHKKHGLSKTNIYKIWSGIVSRCYNPKVRIYKYYGGRGIKMCDEWRNDFKAFYEDMGERPPEKQLDRINNDGPYEKSNCHWVTAKENNPSNKGTLKDDMPGKRFGKWLVLERVIHKPGHWYYACRCDCGTAKIICGGELRRGNTKQCKQCAHKAHGELYKGWSERRKLINV